MTSEEEKNQNQEKEPEINKESKLSNKDDSINKKMEEMYDQHKKEEKTNQRPQSKYQRDQKQNEKQEKEKEDDGQVNEQELINKINEHFNKRQITKKDFSENQNVFLPLDEFYELFKNIHLDLLTDEINYLFNNKNPNKDDGYIYFNTFLENYNFEFYPGESTLINKSNTENFKNNDSSISNYTSLLLNKPDKITPAILNEFTSFKNDILSIVEESKKAQVIKRKLPPIRKESAKRADSTKKIERQKNQGVQRKKPQSANKSTKDIRHPTQRRKINYLKQTLERQRLEEEMIRLTIDKRDKEFQRDCVKKMVLANEYAEKLGVRFDD